MRWSVAHFEQKYAGSPLNVLAMCVLRFLARKDVWLRAREETLHGIVWIKDFLF